MGEWQIGLFGCFSNCGLCMMGLFAPCVVFGRVGEALDKNFWMYCVGMLVPVLDFVLMIMARGQLREKQNIDGGMVEDVLAVLCCTQCALCQLGAEAEVISGAKGMAMAKDQTMSRV